MMSRNEDDQLKATQACRKLLSSQSNPPIQRVINLGVIPKCVEFLTKNHK